MSDLIERNEKRMKEWEGGVSPFVETIWGYPAVMKDIIETKMLCPRPPSGLNLVRNYRNLIRIWNLRQLRVK